MTSTLLAAFLAIGMATVAYGTVGYPLAAMALARRRPGRPPGLAAMPSVTLLIAAHDEAAVIGARIENALALDYPGERLDILIVADGCSDDTEAIVARYATRGVRLVSQRPRRGKAAALNMGVALARGEVIAFSDANAMFRPDALRVLVAPFSDPDIGLVAGEKRILGADGAAIEGFYWRIESKLKAAESRLGGVMGATGEIFAIRRALWRSVPEDAVIEDFAITMDVLAAGRRAVYEPAAISEETASAGLADEFARKSRIAAGGWQALGRHRALFHPGHGWVAWQLASHRLMRWVVMPLLLPLLWLANVALAVLEPLAVPLLAAHTAAYALALLALYLPVPGVLRAPGYFVFLNAAALRGAWRFVAKTQAVTWRKVNRRPLAGQQ